MRKYLLAFIFLLCPVVHAQCALSSGASVGSIQTAINSAATNTCALPNRNTVNFAAGSYTIGSQVNIPCPGAAGLVIQGPTPSGLGTTWPLTLTAILTSTMTNQWAFSGTACAN